MATAGSNTVTIKHVTVHLQWFTTAKRSGPHHYVVPLDSVNVLNDIHKGRYGSTTDYLITIKVSHRQHVSTNQVFIIRSITQSHEITEGCHKYGIPLVFTSECIDKMTEKKSKKIK